MSDKGTKDFVSEYSLWRPRYEQFGRRLRSLASELFEEAGVEYQFIEARAKSVESFEAKVQEKGYDQPLTQCMDLCGLRIVAPDLDRVSANCNVLKREFGVDQENSQDKLDVLDANEFGYRSVHLVVRLKGDRTALKEYKRYDGMVAEIQVRSILQHAWAAIDHKLRYKAERDAPIAIRRQLFRLAAFLEEADERFAVVTREIERYRTHVTERVTSKDYSSPVDFDTLEQYLASSELVSRLLEPMGSHFAIQSDESNQNEASKRISSTVFVCNALGIKTLAELDNVLICAEPFFADWVAILRKVAYVANARVYRSSPIRIALLLCEKPELDEDDLKQSGYSPNRASKIVQAREKFAHRLNLVDILDMAQ